MAAAEDSDIKFELGVVMVELELSVEQTGGGKGGVRFWVVEAGGEHSRAQGRTHRITVPLTPLNKDGSPVLTSDDTYTPAAYTSDE